jgi:uncharacterized protein (TIGR04255 family)
MSEKLANAPIFYTTGQLKFNPVLDMADYIGALQKKWRSRYPDFSVQPLNQFQFQLTAAGQPPEFKVTSTPRWHFKDTEQTSGIVITNDSIVYQTTAYSTSEEFFQPLLDGLQVIHETVTLSYIESVAMRTLDAIIPTKDHQLSFFMKEGLLGLSFELQGEMKHSLLELVLIRPDEQLTTRVAILPTKIGIPADLAPINLTLPRFVNGLNGLHAVLDNDCVQRKRFHYDLSKVADSLKGVKKSVTEVFNKSITAEALEYWR